MDAVETILSLDKDGVLDFLKEEDVDMAGLQESDVRIYTLDLVNFAWSPKLCCNSKVSQIYSSDIYWTLI